MIRWLRELDEQTLFTFVMGIFTGVVLFVAVLFILPPYSVKGFNSTCESGAFVREDGTRGIDFGRRTC